MPLLCQVVEQEGGRKALDLMNLCCPPGFSERVDAVVDRVESVLDELVQNHPDDIVISAPVFSLPSEVSNLDATATFTVTATGYVADIASYHMSIPTLNITDEAFSDGNLSFIVPSSIAAGTTLEVSVYAKDTLGNKSVTTTHITTVGTVTVDAPQIISPAQGATVVSGSGSIIVMASEFSTSGSFTDTHQSSQFQLLRGDTVIATEITIGTSYTFTGLDLTDGETLSARARYEGVNAGWGPWSGENTFTVTLGVVAPGGQRLWLNETGDGVVVEYTDKDGSTKRFAVGLAVSRTIAVWQNEQVDVLGLTNYTDFSGYSSVGMTDAQINALAGYDASTAKANTNALIAAGSPAAEWCRSKTIGEMPCDLPNMNQLRRIYALKPNIDALDSTVKANSTMALVAWRLGGTDRIWSSTEMNSANAWAIHLGGNVGGGLGKTTSYGVTPILELA